MKKTIPFIIIALLAFATNIAIARNYPLTIAGIRVTDTNAANITGQGISGTVSYNPTTRTLTLNNATITHTQHIIDCDSTIFIHLVGHNSLVNISGLGDALYAKGDSVVIEGPGSSSLNAVVFCSGANSANGTHLIVRGGCTLNAFGYYGITATGSRTGELFTIDNSFVNAKGHTDYSIGGFANLVFIHTAINKPAGAYYKSTTQRLVYANDTVIRDTASIVPIYPIRIGKTLVTHQNANDIVGPEIVSGKVQYIDSVKTLLLNHATLSFSSRLSNEATIWCDSNIRILIVDSNHVIRSGNTGYCSAIYLGGQQSVIEGTANSFLQVDSGYNTISSKNLHITGESNIRVNGAIVCHRTTYNPMSKLIIDSCKVFVSHYMHNRMPITGFPSVSLNRSCIVYPPYSHFDTIYRNFRTYSNSGSFYDSIVINPCDIPFRVYPVTVAGTVFHSGNINQLTGNYCTGSIRYDPDSKTLYLRNAQITPSTSLDGIVCDSNITINLTGINTIINQGQKYGILLKGTTSVIEGSHSSALQIQSRVSPSIYALNDLTVRGGCKIEISGRGINGRYDTNSPSTFKVDSSFISITPISSNTENIANFNEMLLHNAYIRYPAGAFYSNSSQYLRIIYPDNSLIVYDSVVIAPTDNPQGIHTVQKAEALIFPNPSYDKINILSSLPMSRLEIFDTKGIKVKVLQSDAKKAQIYVRHLQSGIYILKIHHSTGISVKRIVVRH